MKVNKLDESDNSYAYNYQLNESKSFINYIIKNLSNNKNKVRGFWNTHPNFYNALSSINDFNIADYDVHHINGVHSERDMHTSNTDVHNLSLVKRMNHKEITREYKKVLKNFIEDYINSNKNISLDGNTLYQIMCANEDIPQLLISIVESLNNAGINPNNILSIDANLIHRLIDEIPNKFSTYFSDYYKSNPGNVILVKTLISEYPEILDAFNKDLKIGENNNESK